MSEQASPWSEHSYLDAYGAQAAPEHAFRAGLESLADGDYEFLIVGAELGQAANNDHILTLRLKTGAEGREVDHVYWLNKQQAVNALLADLQALQFPARTWGSRPGQTPLSVAIPDAVSRLRGSRFRARKTSRAGKEAGKIYHDLVILGVSKPTPQASSPSVPPSVPTTQAAAARQWPEAPLPPMQQLAGIGPNEVPVYDDDSDVPF